MKDFSKPVHDVDIHCAVCIIFVELERFSTVGALVLLVLNVNNKFTFLSVNCSWHFAAIPSCLNICLKHHFGDYLFL